MKTMRSRSPSDFESPDRVMSGSHPSVHWRLALGVVLLLASPVGARAVAFDVIVPAQVTIDTEGILGIGFNGGWAWLVATTDTIDSADIEAMTADLIGDEPAVTPGTRIFNASKIGPLEPGEAAGGTVGGFGGLGTLLGPSETRVVSMPFLNAGFDFPSSFDGSATFTGTYQIGADIATYTVEVVFAPGAQAGLGSVQRVSSVPEPSDVALAAAALATLAGLRRRTSGGSRVLLFPTRQRRTTA